MRARLERLGVGGVTARTFHSAALRQLHRLGDPPERIMASKALLLRQLANTLPPPFKFRPAGDLATEIEWAKNRRLTPGTYLDGIGEHEPPIPPDLMFRIFRGYEAEKSDRGYVDFEDLLELTVQALRRAAGRARGGARSLPCVHGRRVPGRQPAAADAARPLARRERRALRRRRRLPVDLRVHGRDPRLPPRAAGSAFPAQRSSGSRTTTARRRRCWRWRTGSCPLSAVPRRSCGRRFRRSRAADAGVPAARGGDGVRRRPRTCASERGSRARGDGGALPDECQAGRLRRTVPRRRDSVSGRVAARTRGGAPAA